MKVIRVPEPNETKYMLVNLPGFYFASAVEACIFAEEFGVDGEWVAC
jgi:hypothetical protein